MAKNGFFDVFRPLIRKHMRDMSGTELRVYLVALVCADGDTMTTYVTPPTIAEMSGADARNVKRGLSALTDRGFLKTLEHNKGGRGKSAVRLVTLPETVVEKTMVYSRRKRVAKGARKGGSKAPERVVEITPSSALDLPNDLPTTTTGAADAAGGGGCGDFLIVGKTREEAVRQHGEQWVSDVEALARLEGKNPLRFALHCLKNPDEVDFTPLREQQDEQRQAQRAEEEQEQRRIEAEQRRQKEVDAAQQWVKAQPANKLEAYKRHWHLPDPWVDPLTSASAAYRLYRNHPFLDQAIASEAKKLAARRESEAKEKADADAKAKQEAELRTWLSDHADEIPAMLARYRDKWPAPWAIYSKVGAADPHKNLLFAKELREAVTSGKLDLEGAAV